MVSLGVWACRYREMQPITFGLGGAKPGAPEANGSAGGAGGGRTRREGEGPSYEMVPIKETDVEGDENV
jgi:protein SYS1